MFRSKANTVTKIVVIFFLVSISNAQVIDFDLSEYTPPEYKRHSLDTEFSLGGNSSFSDGYMDFGTSESDVDNSRNLFSLSGEGIYSYMRYTDNLQRGMTADLKLSGSIYDYDNEQENSPDDRIYLLNRYEYDLGSSLRLSGYNRYYPGNSGFFLETNIFVDPKLSYEKNKTTDEYDFDYTTRIDSLGGYDYYESDLTTEDVEYEESRIYSSGISFDPEILFGFGRIDYVSDARIAVYIYQDLQDRNCLDKLPSKEDIIKLSELITILKNERFFDAREKKIEDITRIDTFLKENGFVKENGPAYFTSLYDNWDYPEKRRSSGYRISAGFVPELGYSVSSKVDIDKDTYYYNAHSSYYLAGVQYDSASTISNDQDISETNADTYTTNVGLFGVLRYEHEIPLSLNLQGSFRSEILFGKLSSDSDKDYDITASSDYSQIHTTETSVDSTVSHSERDTAYTQETNIESGRIAATVSYALRYYPSTRTDMGIALSGSYIYWDDTYEYNEQKTSYNDQAIRIAVSSDANYYFSPQLRLSGNVSLVYTGLDEEIEYNDQKREQDSNQFSLSYGVTLNYYIF
jgi:hypothetical protein